MVDQNTGLFKFGSKTKVYNLFRGLPPHTYRALCEKCVNTMSGTASSSHLGIKEVRYDLVKPFPLMKYHRGIQARNKETVLGHPKVRMYKPTSTLLLTYTSLIFTCMFHVRKYFSMYLYNIHFLNRSISGSSACKYLILKESVSSKYGLV